MTTNYFNNSQHVNISLITLKVSAVCTVQYPNVVKFHEAKIEACLRKKWCRNKKKKNALEIDAVHALICILNYLPI